MLSIREREARKGILFCVMLIGTWRIGGGRGWLRVIAPTRGTNLDGSTTWLVRRSSPCVCSGVAGAVSQLTIKVCSCFVGMFYVDMLRWYVVGWDGVS